MTLQWINQKNRLYTRMVSFFLCFLLSWNTILPTPFVYAQSLPWLPLPGAMINLSQAFTPTIIQGMSIHLDDGLLFDFIVDRGDSPMNEEALKTEVNKLIKYFLASLTIPEDELWVNLSPYEKNRIIAAEFGQTEMGRDLLSQDYLLKQLTASLMYPEDPLGSEFWKRVYQKAQEIYGTTNIPMNTFNKVWILPEKAVVYEQGNSAFILESRLKVMLEEDYLTLQHNLENAALGMNRLETQTVKSVNKVASDIVREVIIPELEKEVNEGKTFANLRQIYNAMILAHWYKETLRKGLLGQIYVDKKKVLGVDVEDKKITDKIYNQYLQAFKKGVYNYIREDVDLATQQTVLRKYFSGGVELSFGGEVQKAYEKVSGDPVAQLNRYPKMGQRLIQNAAKFYQVVSKIFEVGPQADMKAAQQALETQELKPIWGAAGLNPEWEEWIKAGEIARFFELWVKLTDKPVLRKDVLAMVERLRAEGIGYAAEILNLLELDQIKRAEDRRVLTRLAATDLQQLANFIIQQVPKLRGNLRNEHVLSLWRTPDLNAQAVSQVLGQRILRQQKLSLRELGPVVEVIKQFAVKMPEAPQEKPSQPRLVTVFASHSTGPNFDLIREEMEKGIELLGGKSAKITVLLEESVGMHLLDMYGPQVAREYRRRIGLETPENPDSYLNDEFLKEVVQTLSTAFAEDRRGIARALREGHLSMNEFLEMSRGVDVAFMVKFFEFIAEKMEEGYDIELEWENFEVDSTLYSHRYDHFGKLTTDSLLSGDAPGYLHQTAESFRSVGRGASLRDQRIFGEQIPNIFHRGRSVLMTRGINHLGAERNLPTRYPGVAVNYFQTVGATQELFSPGDIFMRAWAENQPLEPSQAEQFLKKDAVRAILEETLWPHETLAYAKWYQLAHSIIWAVPAERVSELFEKIKARARFTFQGKVSNRQLLDITMQWLYDLNIDEIRGRLPDFLEQSNPQAVQRLRASKPFLFERGSVKVAFSPSFKIVIGSDEIQEVNGSTLGEIVDQLVARFPNLKEKLFQNNQQTLVPTVSFLVGEEDVTITTRQRQDWRLIRIPGYLSLAIVSSVFGASDNEKRKEMGRPFGKTDLKFFPLGLGTIWLGRQWPPGNTAYVDPTPQEVEFYLLEAFAKMKNSDGMVMVDTAPAYGFSEERLGQFFDKHPELAEKAFVSTKWGEEFPEAGEPAGRVDHSVEHLKFSVDRSLERLGKHGKIDVLYIHKTSWEVLQDPAVRKAMLEMKQNRYGGIRFLGASISVEGILEEAVKQGAIDWLDVLQLPAPLFEKRQDLMERIHTKGIAIVLNSPIRLAKNQEPRDVFLRLAADPKMSVILTGTRTHLQETIGYFSDENEDSSKKGSGSEIVDKASLGSNFPAEQDVGGINLNPAFLDLQIKRDGRGIPLPIQQQPLDQMNINGFFPVIIYVAPANLSFVLGF